MLMRYNRKTCRGLPKQLKVLYKSKYIRQWLIKNPWLRPMSSFNYAVILIQKVFRSYRCRRKRKRSKSMSFSKSKPAGPRRQLDKYLGALDKYRNGGNRPSWMDGGYSSWCASKLQAWWRMITVRWRYCRRFRFVNQIAVLIIQMCWKSYLQRIKSSRRLTANLSAIEANMLASTKIQPQYWPIVYKNIAQALLC